MTNSYDLRQDLRSVLDALHLKTAVLAAEQMVSSHEIASELQWSQNEVVGCLKELKDAALAEAGKSMAGGWRTTRTGDQRAVELRASRAEGRERYEHTMRQILRVAIERHDGDFLADDWEAWELHEPDLSPVTKSERHTAMDALEALTCVKSIHAHGAPHVRSEVTAKGRMVLGRSDVSLADEVFGPPARASTTNYDQRVGIQTGSMTNQGGIQTGDGSVMNVTITNDQRTAISDHLNQIREALADETLPAEVTGPIARTVEELEAAVNEDEPQVSRLRNLQQQALNAAVTSTATEAGQRLVQLLVGLGNQFVMG